MIDANGNCDGKKRFPDKKGLRTYLNSFNRQSRGRHGRPEVLSGYPCPKCRGWHLTKRR